MRLEEGIAALRNQHVEWDAERAAHVLAGAKHRRARRERAVQRSQLVRRSVLGLASAAALAIVLLRGGAAPAGERVSAGIAAGAIAAGAAGEGGTDAGYARD